MRNSRGEAPTEAVAEFVDQLAEEPDGATAIVHVPGPVLEPQDVAGLGQVRQQGVVAGVLLEVGIVPAEGPGHGVPGPDHGPIHVDRQPREVEPFQLLVEEFAVQGDQPLERLLVNCVSQFTTVRSAGIRARPARRATNGSWAR